MKNPFLVSDGTEPEDCKEKNKFKYIILRHEPDNHDENSQLVSEDSNDFANLTSEIEKQFEQTNSTIIPPKDNDWASFVDAELQKGNINDMFFVIKMKA